MGTALFIANASAGLEDVPALLARAGHQVEVTSDVERALAFVQQKHPDMVLCDVSCPGVDAYRVLSEIRAMPSALCALPVLLIVEGADDDARTRDIGLGADDVMARSMGAERMVAIADARMRRSAENRNALQVCNPHDCPARFQAEMSVFNDFEPAPGMLSLAQLDGLASCDTLWEAERPPVLLVIDIDRFAAINAILGSACGEELLRAVGARLRSFESRLGLLAHVAGDTFAALLPPHTDLPDAERIAEAVRRAMSHPFTLPGRQLCATVSIGIARAGAANGLTELVAQATAAADHALALGGNLVFTFHPEYVARDAERLSVASELRAAIDAGEFRMVYQPKLRLADRVVVGAEALMWWHSPVLGPIPPTVFIPVAEETGLIVELGEFAFRAAANTLRQWRSEAWGRGLTMAVNLSPHQLAHRQLPSDLAAVLDQTGLPADAFILEITESAFVGQEPGINDAIATLRQQGFRLSMDDFGTGYSSLSYLHRIPLDSLKIDQSFVHGLPGDSVACGIVEAIVALARRLGIDIAAEGVETEEQADYLRSRGVGVGQGMLLGPPVGDPEFRTLCRRGTAVPLHDYSAA